MKNVYLTIALLFLAFTSCKNADAKENGNEIDTTAVGQTTTVANDTLAAVTDTTSAATADTVDVGASSNVKLPNKVSTTQKVIPGEKGKYALAETKWGLIELNGKKVESSGRDYFINFDSKSGTFRSFVGCNNISGKYFMKSEGKVGFTDVVSTRKACNDNNTERNFFNNLQKVNNYMIEDNGKIMHLHIGKKNVAKFEALR